MATALLTSTALVALAEIGDKTQLLSFVLAARLRRPWPICLGILVATVANHALAAWAGSWVASLVAPDILRWVVGVAFLAFGLWTLKPDTLDDDQGVALTDHGVFWTTTVVFFMAEMGDKTQFATIALGARFDSLTQVVIGTTLGMMLANVPAVWMGEKLAHRLPLDWIRRAAALLFALTGVATLIGLG